jgi:uroporphyrinogen-III synthase
MRPLAGKQIAITRAAEQSGGLVERLRALGAEPLVCPTIAIAPPENPGPLDAAIGRLAEFDWLVVTSANAVAALLERMAGRDLGPEALAHLRLAAVGPATAEALTARGLVARLVPSEQTAAGLLAEIGDARGRRVLLPQAHIARPTLAAGLRERGALVETVTAYRTVPGAGVATLVGLLRSGKLDALLFASPSAATYLLEGLDAAGLARGPSMALIAGIPLVSIGPTTSAALRDAGLPVAAEARPHTAEGLVAAVLELLAPLAAVAPDRARNV